MTVHSSLSRFQLSGHLVKCRDIGVFAVRDGKITSVREYTDTQHVEHVLFGQR